MHFINLQELILLLFNEAVSTIRKPVPLLAPPIRRRILTLPLEWRMGKFIIMVISC